MRVPSSEAEWHKLAEEFKTDWQFPHVVGAIDGKHVNIKAPAHSGSEYFNYKKGFCIALLAIADASVKFIAFDLGAPGSNSDGGIFKNSGLGQIRKNGNFPSKSKLEGIPIEIPYFLIGNEAFVLDVNLMKPFPIVLPLVMKKSSIIGSQEHSELLKMRLVFFVPDSEFF